MVLGCPECIAYHDRVQWVKGRSLKAEIRAEENRSTAAGKALGLGDRNVVLLFINVLVSRVLCYMSMLSWVWGM